MTDDEAIKRACLLADEVRRLDVAIDAILEPICLEAMNIGDIEAINALVNKLPRGFHRSELLTFLTKTQRKAHV